MRDGIGDDRRNLGCRRRADHRGGAPLVIARPDLVAGLIRRIDEQMAVANKRGERVEMWPVDHGRSASPGDPAQA